MLVEVRVLQRDGQLRRDGREMLLATPVEDAGSQVVLQVQDARCV